jgi:hypothetical protein
MTHAISGFFKSEGFREYRRSLRFALYTMRRPLDGFWDLIHEKRGSMAAAHTLVVLAVAVEILRLVLTSFQFININMEFFSAYFVILQVLAPIGLWTVANWCLTTLFDGKGKMAHIYMGMAYAYTPMIIINAILIPLSHIITYQEGAFFWILTGIGTVWFVLLLLCAMKEIHDYSFTKTVITSLLTIFAIGVMLFIFMMFFAVVSDGIVYFYSIYQEISIR